MVKSVVSASGVNAKLSAIQATLVQTPEAPAPTPEVPLSPAPAPAKFNLTAVHKVATIPQEVLLGEQPRAVPSPVADMFAAMALEVLGGWIAYQFVPLAFFADNPKVNLANLTPETAKGKVRGRFTEWVKKDPLARSNLALTLWARQPLWVGTDDAPGEGPGVSVWMQKKTK